jgi:hypothetical protein
MHEWPGPVLAPDPKVVRDYLPGREVIGQQPPRAAAAYDIKDAVEGFPLGGVLRSSAPFGVGLSKGRQHEGPTQTKHLVTKLPAWGTARQMVAVSRRRWGVEVLCQEVTGVVGVGQQQVTNAVERGERSVALALMASLLLRRLRAPESPADRPWSACR